MDKFKNCLVEELVHHLLYGGSEFSKVELISEIGLRCVEKKDSADKIGEKTLSDSLNNDDPACRATAAAFLFLIPGAKGRNTEALTLFAEDIKNDGLLEEVDTAVKLFNESRQETSR